MTILFQLRAALSEILLSWSQSVDPSRDPRILAAYVVIWRAKHAAMETEQ